MKLSAAEIDTALTDLPGWSAEGNAITKTYQCDDFAHAMDFVVHVGELAEEHDHHPDIDIRYDKVTLRLSTHSAGGVTGQDVAMARLCEGLP